MHGMDGKKNFTSEKLHFGNIRLIGEPSTGWKIALKKWGPAWNAYIYTCLSIEILLLTWTLFNIVAIYRRRLLASRPYFLTLNVMVLIFTVSRIIVFTVDPHATRDILSPLASNLLFNISFPTLTVGYFLLYISLKLCTIPSGHLSKLPVILTSKFIVVFSIICFAVSLFTDTIVYFESGSDLMIIVCQLFYVVWGIVFFILFMSLIMLFRKRVRITKSKMERSCYRMGHCRRDFRKTNMKSLPLYVKISFISGLFILMLVIYNIIKIVIEIDLLQMPMSSMAPMRSKRFHMCNRYRAVWAFYASLCAEEAIQHLLALSLLVCGTQPLKKLRVVKLTNSLSVATASSLPVTDFSSVSCITSTSTGISQPATIGNKIPSTITETAAPHEWTVNADISNEERVVTEACDEQSVS